MKILVIDDEEDLRSVCCMSLSMIGGAEVVEAGSGPEGLEKAVIERPDVIILDLMMPEMDGTQVLLKLRDNPETSHIPVIFLTVKGMFLGECERLKSLGALAVLSKPFDPMLLMEQIQKILEDNLSVS